MAEDSHSDVDSFSSDISLDDDLDTEQIDEILTVENPGGVQPYRFEPERSSEDDSDEESDQNNDSDENVEGARRLDDLHWSVILALVNRLYSQ